MRAMIVICLTLGTFSLRAAAQEKADPKTAVIGKWLSDDEDRLPLEFFKDGTAKIGFIREKGKWLIATGKYTVSDKGRVECDGTYKDTTFKSWWNLKDGVLVGPSGPNPMVRWVKVKKDEKN